MVPPSSTRWKTMTLPPLSPTDNMEPCLSKEMDDSKSCFVMFEGSDSPSTFKLIKFKGFNSVIGNSWLICGYLEEDLDFMFG